MSEQKLKALEFSTKYVSFIFLVACILSEIMAGLAPADLQKRYYAH